MEGEMFQMFRKQKEPYYFEPMSPDDIRVIRTASLRRDYECYATRMGTYDEVPQRTFEEWARWVWQGHQRDKRSVFKGMSFVDYVNV